jgi:MFS family permease
MSLYMMVFAGGTPIGAPLLGWITDTYGPRIGFATGGLVSLTAAGVIGLVLARVGGLKVSFAWRHGHPRVRFVARERLATAA